MKIAIIHEMLIKLGGAERVLQEFMSMYPDADVFTLMYDSSKVGKVFPKEKIRCTGPAQWLFRLTKKPRASLPLMPFSIGMLDFSDYDLVISSSSGFAHGARVKKKNELSGNNSAKKPPSGRGMSAPTDRGIYEIINPQPRTSAAPLKRSLHVCYCHSPARYLWDWSTEIQAELGISNEKFKVQSAKGRIVSFIKIHFFGPLVRLLFWWLRKVDLKAAKRPDIYIANSEEVQKRIKKYYNRDSVVLWPAVDTQRFAGIQNAKGIIQNDGINIKNSDDTLPPEKGGDDKEGNMGGLKMESRGDFPVSQRSHYIITSALTPFKRLDIPVRVLSKLGINLKIIGGGDQREELQKLAGPTVEFLGRLSDEEVAEAYKYARGFLMPQKEDAGIAPIEAMAAGLPVFGQAAGGLLEINIDGVTGRFFPEENDESFEEGFLKFHQEVGEGKYDDAERIIEHAKKFDTQVFRREFQKIVT